jgi:hypothetical protein
MAELGQPVATGGVADAEPFESLDAMQRAHAELKNSHRESALGPDDLRAFLRRAVATGRILTEPGNRREAQGIIDYWTSELVTLPGATAKDFMPMLLEQPRPVATASGTDAPEQRSRDIIRFSAAARLWRDNGKKHGYLLFGDALVEGAKYSKWDSDIAALVAASQQARRKTRIRLAVSAAILGTAVGCVAFLLWAHSSLLPAWSDKHVLRVSSGVTDTSTDVAEVRRIEIWLPFLIAFQGNSSTFDKTAQVTSLRWLEFYQPYLPPDRSDLNFSRATLSGLNLSKLKLYGPKFVEASLSQVVLEDAKLPSASFSDGFIERSAFKRARLDFSQFLRADIRNTTFAGAGLYRATFNEALLCHVNFSQADLRKAWFRDVKFGGDFAKEFTNAPWWLASGWNGNQIIELSKLKHDDLRGNTAFTEDIKRDLDALAITRPGTFERAAALNDLAWTHAIYGLDMKKTSKASAAEPLPRACLKPDDLNEADQKLCDACLKADGVPDDALDAAEQAVCIMKFLNLREGSKGNYRSPEKNVKDTLAYLLMQRNGVKETNEAVAYFDEILEDPSGGKDPAQAPEKESIFRNAVAQFYLAKKESDPDAQRAKTTKALAGLNKAIVEKNYVPSHELHTLKSQMEGAFWDMLMRHFDKINPASTTQAPC